MLAIEVALVIIAIAASLVSMSPMINSQGLLSGLAAVISNP